jgi:hypothetical protein
VGVVSPEVLKVDPPDTVVERPVLVPLPNTRRPPQPELIEVAVMVRPFGRLQVDDGAATPDELARHNLKLAAGTHRFTVTCDLCESQGRTMVVDVKPGEVIPLVAPLKPSLVTFQGWPDDAKVRVGGVEKTIKESQGLPFRVSTPPSGSPEMRHKVEYVVTVGDQVERGVKFAVPGRPLVIDREAK